MAGFRLQLELLIKKGVRSFNTCMLPGLDMLCAAYIAGLINTYNREKDKESILTTDYADLRISVFNNPSVISLDTSRRQILDAASSIHYLPDMSDEERFEQAIKSSTHMFAVMREGSNPIGYAYAERSGLRIIRFTQGEILSAYR